MEHYSYMCQTCVKRVSNKQKRHTSKQKETTNTARWDVANFVVEYYAADFAWRLRTRFEASLYRHCILYECLLDIRSYTRRFFQRNSRYLSCYTRYSDVRRINVRSCSPGGTVLETLVGIKKTRVNTKRHVHMACGSVANVV